MERTRLDAQRLAEEVEFVVTTRRKQMNQVVLLGRLVRDPELRATGSGASVCSFCVACDRRFQKRGAPEAAGGRLGEKEERQADFISCIAWQKTAEFVKSYFTKGQRICLSGSIQTRSWTDETGGKRYATEVVADHVEFAQDKGEGMDKGPLEAPDAQRGPRNVGDVLGKRWGDGADEAGRAAAGGGSGIGCDDVDGFMPAEEDDLPF